ncbi:phage tail protein [Pseudoxanthomonas sp. PXM05]|uniref:phage tail protein n=1 Tax=Pseudoxanthomonas sp. PXM05 TaxID=2854775 RepID=UPI001C493A76|nr:phage tail protein [Pseudoxanthomonas sp. PXM05]MBV7475404.1 phage tail protein [Pseudoxanthomonas sp. PXM05]
MSKSAGQLIGGGIGAVVGYIYGGPQGAQLGWTIGSAVGGYVDPVKNFGPRLQDAAQQTAIDGVPITFGYGTFPTMGNVTWRSPLREVTKKKREGKGGSAVSVTYTYYRSYAIGVCEGPITGFLQIKKNGKIVYDARPDAELLALGYTTEQVKKIRAAQTKFLNNVELYLGDDTQEPDPTIESHEGVGNVGANRGLAYIVVEEDDVTAASGAIPQYEFVVSACGTTGISGGGDSAGWLLAQDELLYPSIDGLDWSTPGYLVPGWVADSNVTRAYRYESEVLLTGPDFLHSTDTGTTWRVVEVPFSISLDGGNGVRSGAFWFVSGGTGFGVLRYGGADVIQLGWSARSLAFSGVELYAVRHLETSMDVRLSDGTYVEGRAIVPSGSVYYPTLAVGGGELGVLFDNGLGGLRIRVSTNNGVEFVDADCPFTYSPGQVFICKFSAELGVWVVAYGNRVAYGPSLSALTLSSHEFSGTPNQIDEDGEKFIICGSSMLLESSVDGNNWTSVTPPEIPGSPALPAIVSLGYFGVPAGSEPIPDAPGWYIGPDGLIYGPGSEYIDRCRPVLGSIVADLCLRAGLTSDEYDVSDLTDLVDGFRIHGEAGVDAMIAPLMQAYFFDVTEFDGKVRFVKRGGDAVMSIGPDDLVERDGDAVEWERVQEAELLRKVTVAAFCPEAGFARSTQESERRSITVEAKGESLIEIPVVGSKDFLKQVSDKKCKVGWSEPDKCRFSLPYRLTALTPGDIVHLYDEDGAFKRIRLSSIELDSGCYYTEASMDRRSAYTSAAVGVSPPPPLIVDPPVIGPTTAAIINVPIWTNDDELGVYIAARGVFAGWNGANIEFSTDGGANYSDGGTIDEAATIGQTLTGLLAEYSSEYLASQTLDVSLPDAPSSVDYATLLRYFNRAAVQRVDGSWEILQYQTVTTIGGGQYRLSGLARGRYATEPSAIASGSQFVLLDSSVKFIQTPNFMLGSTLLVRISSVGTTPDAAVPQTFTYSVGMSQLEWAPFYLQGSRDGSDNVSLSWIGRARLGTSRRPMRSKYFAGYAVEIDDGTTVTVARTLEATLSVSSAADPITVRIAAVNSITGIGPYSEAITV